MLLNVLGQTAYCYTGGKTLKPELPTVAFIHGAQNDHSVWALQSRYFAHHGFNVLAVDLPGHSRSKGEPLTSVEAMADWLITVLDAAGVEQAALIGHSMGSLIALEASFRAPSRVTKLALAGTGYPMKVSENLLSASLNDEQAAITMVNIWSHSSMAQKPSCPGPGFYVMGGSHRLMQRVSTCTTSPVFHLDFSACNAYSNGENAAAAVRCPTLLLLGKHDLMTPPKAASRLASLIANVRTVTIDHCGHQLMSEQPDAVLDTLFAFVKER